MNINNLNFKKSYFMKIFIFSTSIIFITILINYLLSIFFLDSFYITRKENTLKRVATEIEDIIADDDRFFSGELIDYVDIVRNTLGIEVRIANDFQEKNLENFSRRNSSNPFSNQFNPETLGFSQVIHKISRVKFLVYQSELPYNQKLTLITSLSVMNSHKEEFRFFNILTTLIAIGVSLILTIIFSKKITNNIKRLNNAAKKISNMEFPQNEEIIIYSQDELGELSQNLALVSKNLNTSISNLKNFVSNASHELKTPISVLTAHGEYLLKNKELSTKERDKYLKIILKTSFEMSELLKNLLALTKVTTPNFKINKTNTLIEPLINEALELYEHVELEKDIKFNKKIEKITVFIDKSLFQIVINNLIDNALKYSPDNCEIFVEFIKNKLIIKNFVNFPINIKRDSLFDAFTRGENSLEIQGYGLGLSLCREILILHNIKFEIEPDNEMFIFYIDFNS